MDAARALRSVVVGEAAAEDRLDPESSPLPVLAPVLLVTSPSLLVSLLIISGTASIECTPEREPRLSGGVGNRKISGLLLLLLLLLLSLSTLSSLSTVCLPFGDLDCEAWDLLPSLPGPTELMPIVSGERVVLVLPKMALGVRSWFSLPPSSPGLPVVPVVVPVGGDKDLRSRPNVGLVCGRAVVTWGVSGCGSGGGTPWSFMRGEAVDGLHAQHNTNQQSKVRSFAHRHHK